MLKLRTYLSSLVLSVVPIIVSVGFLLWNYNDLPYKVGLFFSRPWGDLQLVDPKYIFILPISATIFVVFNHIFAIFLENKGKRDMVKLLRSATVGISLLISIVCIFIVYRYSFRNFYLNFEAFGLVFPWFTSFALVYFVTPHVINFAKRKNLIDDPKTHLHPGQLLTKPTPRAGALAFFIAFLLCALLFLPISKSLIGIILGTLLLVIIGLVDDRKKYVSPKFRLLLQILSAGIVVASGVGISYIRNPLGSLISLDRVIIPVNILGQHNIVLFADIFAIIWLVFLANAVSWSNGIDGQFAGFSGIALLVISLVALKTGIGDNDPTQINLAKLAVIASGASFGMAPFTWFPQKVLWGFGATAVGLIIGFLSIMSLSKVYVVIMVLLIPLIDAVITGIRRILQKKSPFSGDRGHLHHRLLDLGWSKSKIALFYWLISALFGVLAVLYNENDIDLDVVRFGAMAVIIIVVINLIVEREKAHKKPIE
jgi:UDP-GlcNAc:undecaprenyl-phosphate GlcNAc-1-phosphate transferase